MLIKRVYNNNVAMATDETGAERIVIGRGLTFKKRPGDEIDPALVEKVFSLEDEAALGRLEKLIRNIPSVYLHIAEEIVEMLRREGLAVDDNLLIALTDHISMSLEREKDGVRCENPLLLEIRQFYKKEFALAHRAAEIIHEHLDIWISDEEQGFITLHIVNASMEQRADQLILSIRMIQDIFGIVRSTLGVELDEDSLQYERFLRHLQFFSQRVLDENASQSEDDFLFLLGHDQYPSAFSCADAIGAYVEKTYGHEVTNAEKGYLAYHIMNLVNATNKERSA